MKLEQQVTSLKLSKKLKELGCKQDSLFYWDIEKKEVVFRQGQSDWKDCERFIQAYTSSELGDILPEGIGSGKQNNGEVVCWNQTMQLVIPDDDLEFYADTEANAMAKMLCFLIENGIIKL